MNLPPYLYGSIAPTFTVFTAEGKLDLDGEARLLDYMLDRGSISAFFIRSGMGQMYTFSMDEVKAITQLACAKIKGHSAVLIGTSGIWDRNYDRRPDPALYLRQAVELSQYAQDCGADAVVHTIPEALVPLPDESISTLIIRYFEHVCAAVNIPVLFYQPPGTQPEYCLTPELLRTIAQIDNLVAGKVSSADAGYIFDLARAVKDESFSLIIGNETIFYAGLMLGSRACIGQGTSLNPQIIKAMVDHYVAGDLEACLSAQEDVNILVRECPNAVEFFKRYISEQGYPVSIHPRKTENNPYLPNPQSLSIEEYNKFKHLYERILDKYNSQNRKNT